MTSLKNSLLGSSMVGAPPLASFSGWAGPVVRAKRRTGCSDGQFNPPRSLDGASEILEARQRAEGLRLIAEGLRLIAEAREMGKAHGGVWFELMVKVIEHDLEIGHTPDLADNIPLYLTRFGEACEAYLSNVAAVFGPEGRDAGFAYWTAARGEYAARVLILTDRLLREIGKVVGMDAIPNDMFEGLSTLVVAFVFPGYGVDPKDNAWRQAITERFDAVRALLPEHQPTSV
jgi:hypothetical protein